MTLSEARRRLADLPEGFTDWVHDMPAWPDGVPEVVAPGPTLSEALEQDAPEKIRVFKYVRHSLRSEYERLGWVENNGLAGTHHGAYSTFMEWPFPTDPVEPEGE